MGERFFLEGHQPCEVGLVFGVHAGHEFDVRAVVVGEVAVPGAAEVAVAPCPLLLAGRHMVGGHVEHAGAGVVFVSAFKVVFGVDSHVGGGHLDILVVGDVDAGRVVHLVVCAGGDWEGADCSFAMVEDGVDVGGEYALVVVVDGYCGVGPPQECLWQRSGIVEHAFDFEVGFAGTQGEAGHPFLVEHALALVDPHGDAAVGELLYGAVDGHEGRRTVVLGPVEFYAARYPRPGKPYEGRLDDMVVVDEVAIAQFVVGHLHAPAQLRKYHYFDVLVLYPHGVVFYVGLRVGDGFNHGVGIYHARRSLVDALL